ncbi:hypothetical protein F5Y11DRAFT_346399 [Daldinia sp. FL1419]|nr:hypothetical protein F5Y11DRAFT_346399 [Daldinia sp. FL1419]
MSDKSNIAAHFGATPSKPTHNFTGNPPTGHPTDQQSLQEYRLRAFQDGPDSVPLVHDGTTSSESAKASHEARIAAELEAILSRLG